jgi:hypothetical protein
MTTKVIFLGLALFLATPLQAMVQQDEDVRGAFLTTRPKPTGRNDPPKTMPSRRRPKPNPTKPDDVTKPADPGKVETPKPISQRMGLGLTLFMRDTQGLAVRTDPTREFRKGDRVRVLLETNTDGYLYIFNTTDGGKPVMIFPDPELDEAGNYIQGHVPFEIPSSVAAEERLRWFSFDQNAGTERLYFVFTREPLSGVPIEDDLLTYCRENKSKCPWQPGTDVWAQIQKEMAEPTQIAKATSMGTAQSPAEHRAATRGIGLNRDDPEPSLIMLTASTSKNMLVATLDLIHKAVSSVVQ